ncbi:group II intron reverse transcriptase/maturase [Oceanobacillus iheyensis]|uniref:group II intron reverse transcriptase/maturase n=1 Tax=Oceanobacillus iheyensis TaxID=182710 RepID=UPI00031ED765|nr:group II intron reverse transcriptase/maturase [Oceanobacillus iheyensis]
MLMNQILSRDNLILALKRVERNKGSHGIDEMSVKFLRRHLYDNWDSLRENLRKGTYTPSPVRRVEIPKPSGGVRMLGIPTVTDRFIQQAIAQVLHTIFDPTFSEHSYGFRPNRQGHDAVRKARGFIKEGYRWVIDMDLEKFFDKVNHDKLMGVLAKRIKDKELLRLIRKYLQSGVMINGIVVSSEEGTPQGGPLSPLLSNIILDDLDKELEERGLRFVRYADDCNIYVRTKKAGNRVMNSITTFIEEKLHLKVNKEKSAVDRPWKRKFLGFSFTNGKNSKIRIAKESIMRLKQKIREITSRSKPFPMEVRIEKLNKYLMGWCGYYALAETPSKFEEFDKWIRRRLRMCMWKQWKLPRTKVRKLISLGVPDHKAYEWGNTRKNYWRISKSPILSRTLGNSYWSRLGLKSLYQRYEFIRNT